MMHLVTNRMASQHSDSDDGEVAEVHESQADRSVVLMSMFDLSV